MDDLGGREAGDQAPGGRTTHTTGRGAAQHTRQLRADDTSLRAWDSYTHSTH